MKPHIYNVRGARVMLDSDLATVFGVETKVLNQKVRRNMPLFSEGSVFQLTKEECQSERISCSRSQIVTLNGGRGSNIKYTPFAFTKEGVTVLKTLMKSQVEVDFSEEPLLPVVTENCWNEGTVVLYQPDNRPVNLEVKVTDENVWLSRNQIAILFDRDIKTISKHINNSMLEELQNIPTVANFATVQIEGDRKVTRYIEYYNLDVIISVGYRVKSNNGIAFRRWANKVLKENVLYHNSITKRFERLENRVTKTEER